MNILVTGATGFVGSHLTAKLIKEGYQVKALVRPNSPSNNIKTLAAQGVELVQGDITDKAAVDQAVSGADKVFHIAALFRQAKHPDQIYWDVNVAGTRNVLDACLKHKVKRVIHCSTIGVLSHIEKPPADETYPYNPGDIYQETKAEGEKLALRYSKEKGLSVVVVRPAMIYGPGDLRLLKLFKSIAKRKFIMIGNGKTLAHFVYVADLVSGFLLAAERDGVSGEIFTFAENSHITLNELTAIIAKELGVTIPKIHIPAKPVQLAGSICEWLCKPFGIEPPLYRRRVDFFTKDRSFNINKAKNRLGYNPKVNIEEGVQRTIKWYQKEGLL